MNVFLNIRSMLILLTFTMYRSFFAIIFMALPIFVCGSTIPPAQISDDRLLKDSDCMAIGRVIKGEVKDYYHIEMDIAMASGDCSVPIISMTIGQRFQGVIRYPVLGQYYLVVLSKSNLGYWLHPAYQSIIPLNKLDSDWGKDGVMEGFSKEDKIPLRAFVRGGNSIWVSHYCDSFLTYNGMLKNCNETTSTLIKFMPHLKMVK